MKISKKKLGELNKCYSMAELMVDGEPCLLAAAEKQDPCYLFDAAGNRINTVWDGPGGVMTMAALPGQDSRFLATRKFYSPNDAAEASIVLAEKTAAGWDVHPVTDLPFVHRFGLLERNGRHWIIACALKSGHEHKEDWSKPGAVYGARLPEDPKEGIKFQTLMTGLLRNHGYSQTEEGQALIAAENGTFLFTPPAAEDETWEITQISAVPSSDSVLLDFDGDGKPELGMISPFHGAAVTIWHLDQDGQYVPQWKLPLPEAETEMVHATWAGVVNGKPSWIVGWRKGTRSTIIIRWNPARGTYGWEVIDTDAGAANALVVTDEHGQQKLICTNREINEIAQYELKEED